MNEADKLANAPKDSGYVETWAGEEGNSSACWSSGISLATSGASSRTSFGSGSLITIPRIASARKAASDSQLNNANPNSSSHGNQPQNRNHKTRLAMTLFFSPNDQLKEM